MPIWKTLWLETSTGIAKQGYQVETMAKLRGAACSFCMHHCLVVSPRRRDMTRAMCASVLRLRRVCVDSIAGGWYSENQKELRIPMQGSFRLHTFVLFFLRR